MAETVAATAAETAAWAAAPAASKEGIRMIRMQGIRKEYRMGDSVLAALDGVDIHIKPHEFVSIIGPSGSGKSTLMNIIGCLDMADEGAYYLDGQEIDDYSEDELADIRTAVSEAVTNCIVHAYPDAIGEIILQARLYPEGRVVIKIRDRGCGIEDIRQAMEPLFTTGGEERSGLGFSVMESFSDKLRVTSRKGKGTVVTLEKYIAPRERQAKTN